MDYEYCMAPIFVIFIIREVLQNYLLQIFGSVEVVLCAACETSN